MTLLLIVYEMLHGDLGATDNILNCGLAVFRHSITLFHDNEGTKNSMEDIEHALPRLAIMGLFTHRLNSTWSHINHLRVEPEFMFPNPGINPISKAFTLWGRFYTVAVTSLCRIAYDSSFSAFSANARQANFLRGLREWKSILDHYLVKGGLSRVNKRALSLTLLHWDVMWITVNCSLDSKAVLFDTYMADFGKLLLRCMHFIREELVSDAPRLMMFGDGIFMPLLCIVKCCRNHDLRMTAASVAYNLPWQEGTWDSRVVLLGHLGAVSMEENERDGDGPIAPSSRWSWRGGDVNAGADTMASKYVRIVPNECGERVAKTLDIDLSRWPEICSTVGCKKDHATMFEMRGHGDGL